MAKGKLKIRQELNWWCTADKEAVIAGTVLGPTEFADPRFLLPALLACASEDWDTVRSSNGRVKGIFPGFKLQLTPDPGSLLGYRVERSERADRWP